MSSLITIYGVCEPNYQCSGTTFLHYRACSVKLGEKHRVKNRGFYIEIYLEIRREKTWVENFPQWDHLTPSLLAQCSLYTGELTLVLLVCLPEEGKGVLERSSDGCVGC